MNRWVVAGAALLVSTGAAIPTLAMAQPRPAKANRSSRNGGWVICREHAFVHASPAVTFSPSHPTKLRASDVLESCSSSDPTIERGIAIVKDTSSALSCASGRLSVVGRIRWNNGRTTEITASASNGGGFVGGTGHVVRGEFAGRPFAALDKLDIDQIALQLCQSSTGLSTVAADGEIAIGNTSVLGVPWTP
jgi:hypothetical protein